MRCPIWVPMLFPTSCVVCTSVTGGATCRGALHRRHPPPPPTLVGCPVAGRTRVYIHSALLRRGCARTANSAGSPASGPHDMQRKVADLIPEKNTEAAAQQESFLNAAARCWEEVCCRILQACGGVLLAPDSKLLPSKAVGCTIPGIFIHREFILARKHKNDHRS